MDLIPALKAAGFVVAALLPPLLGAFYVDTVDAFWPRVLKVLHWWLAATVILGASTVLGALVAGRAPNEAPAVLWQTTGWTGAALAVAGYAAVSARVGGKVFKAWFLR